MEPRLTDRHRVTSLAATTLANLSRKSVFVLDNRSRAFVVRTPPFLGGSHAFESHLVDYCWIDRGLGRGQDHEGAAATAPLWTLSSGPCAVSPEPGALCLLD